MAQLLWLAKVLRDAGLTVHEVDGWKDRGDGPLGDIRGITCHATAGSRNSSDKGEINTILNGSDTAPPPIAQLYLGRQGHWFVVASGLCNHNKRGWAGPNKGLGNRHLIGIEAANNNGRHGEPFEPWPDVQYRSYVRGVAALVRKLGISVDRVAGHKEHQPGGGKQPPGEKSTKTDPTFDMRRFRTDVAAVLAGKKEEEDDMANVRQADWEALIWRVEGLVNGRAEVAAGPTKGSVIQLNVNFNALNKKIAALGTAVSAVAPDVAKRLRDEFDEIEAAQKSVLAKVDQVDEAVVAGIGAGESPDAIAERLRAILGDQAGVIGALLSQETPNT